MTKASCHELCKCAHPYLDGELEPSEILQLEAHLESCSVCAQRLAFERSMRAAVRRSVRSTKAPEALRLRVMSALSEVQAAEGRPNDVLALPPRMLSWRIVGPLAAAAVVALVLGSISKRVSNADAQIPMASGVGSAAAMSLDSLLEELVDQHAHPLPPETANPVEMAGFDRFVGVPVRAPTWSSYQGTLLGGRMLPIRQNRAAMLQYMLTDGHRVSLYVYNPRQVRLAASPRLREQVIGNSPVYVGWVHGYSVAATDKRGVGYVIASDLDEQASSNMIVAVGHSP